MSRFWRLERPHESDYRNVFVNGELRWAHELPATGCRTCARIRRSGRFLPVDCPNEWRTRSDVTPSPRREHRVTNDEFARLREELGPALPSLPKSLGVLQPGDRFQPALLRVPSRPETDFLWPEVGQFLVSERVRAGWVRSGLTGVTFSRVEYARVGQRSSRSPLAPRGGAEPEDMLRRIPPDKGEGLQSYFAVTVTGTSGLPPGVDAESICPECDRARGSSNDPARRLVFTPGMWRGEDVTVLATTLYTIVTEKVRQTLEDVGATNVTWSPADEAPRGRLA